MRYFLLLALLFASTANASTCRDPAVKHQFDKISGYPHGRKGYIVDHVCALVQGGLDSITNMQYQTIAESKAKDRVENSAYGRALYCNSKNSTPTRQVFNCK